MITSVEFTPEMEHKLIEYQKIHLMTARELCKKAKLTESSLINFKKK